MNSEDNGKSYEGAVYTRGELRAFVLMLARKVPSQSPQNRMRRRLRLHQAPVRGNWFPYEVLGDYVRTKENHKRLAIFEPRAQVQFVIGVAEFADDPYLRPFYKLVFEEAVVRELELMIELAEMRRRRLEALFRPMFLIGLLRLRILKKRRAKAEKAEKRAKRRKAKELSREETLLRGNERKVE